MSIHLLDMSEWYNSYLQSEHWQGIKDKTRVKSSSFQKRGCLICGNKCFDIHHLDYRYLGKEKLTKHIAPLCRQHHQEFHDWQNQANKLPGDLGLWIQKFHPRQWSKLSHVQKHKTTKYSSANKIQRIDKQMKIVNGFIKRLDFSSAEKVTLSTKMRGALAPHTNKILDYIGLMGESRHERLLAMKTQLFDRQELIVKLKNFRAILEDYYGIC